MNHTPTSAAIIAGAGMGHRLGADLPKALIQIDGVTLIERAFASLSPVVDEIVITAPAGFEELVHDAARALATSELATKVLSELERGEAAVIPALSVVDTIKEVDRDGYVRNTPDRAALKAVQTPQGFSVDVLKRAHEASQDATDDAALVEALGIKVKTISGEARAMKITNPEDIATALLMLRPINSDLRVGVGTDAHAFSSDSSRQLWLGGIHWSDVAGVDGHSDGDVAAHAICDALFSATGLGDLGSNFGISDPQYAGASGAKLLSETLNRITAAGYQISNVSVQIVCNKPKIGTRRTEAISALSHALGGAPVSVTATSTDGLGFTGEGKGISAIATALVVRKK
ncbi:MAG: 2-C-methyl-D-erythritol 2,4-cyclodiphosphate synthase [Actinobacteria bacterium]|nr:2-C-methyl-D-erythritol 2,4-cyclodiphosphate synthase [Actinomycetota bacterium]